MTALIAWNITPTGLPRVSHAISSAFSVKPAVRRERHGPAHWFLCEQVENNGEVTPSATRPDIGQHHRTTPDLVPLRRTVAQDDSG